MDIDARRLRQMSPAELIKLVERASDDYRPVMTMDEYFDAQTGACAVLQKKGGGPETRQLLQMNSGFSTERRAKASALNREILDWADKNGYTPKQHGTLVEPGPFKTTSKGQTSAYTKAADGSRIPYDPKTKIGADGELTVLKHHAEMKIVDWAEAHGYEVVALAPTRGCCPNCQHALQKALGEEKFKSVVPASRQNPKAFGEHLQKNFGDDISKGSAIAKGSEIAKGGHGAAPAEPHVELPAHPHGAAGGAKLKLPPGLEKFPAVAAKMSSHLGTATTALDAFNTAGDVSKDLRAGHTEAAARKTLEFGGRTWGGIEGAALGAEAGAIVGSIVPGPGTAIGAAAGGVIGGIVGASAGEDAAKKLFDGLKNLGKQSHGAAGGQSPYANDALQRYMYETTSAAVGTQLDTLHRTHPALSGEALFDGLKGHPAEVLKPVAESGERLLRGHVYRSEAVVRALDGDGSGKHGSSSGHTSGGLTKENTVDAVLGKKHGDRGHSPADREKRNVSPLDRGHD